MRAQTLYKEKKKHANILWHFYSSVEGARTCWAVTEKECLHWSLREAFLVSSLIKNLGLPWGLTFSAWLSGERGSVGELPNLRYPALGCVLCRSWGLWGVRLELPLRFFNLDMGCSASAPSRWINNLWRSELEATWGAFRTIRKPLLLCCL